jgi:hypothetical protein
VSSALDYFDYHLQKFLENMQEKFGNDKEYERKNPDPVSLLRKIVDIIDYRECKGKPIL